MNVIFLQYDTEMNLFLSVLSLFPLLRWEGNNGSNKLPVDHQAFQMFSFNGAFKQSLHECKLIFSPCCVKRIEHFYCCAAFTQHCCRVFNDLMVNYGFRKFPQCLRVFRQMLCFCWCLLLLQCGFTGIRTPTPSTPPVWPHEHTDLKLPELLSCTIKHSTDIKLSKKMSP